MGNPNLNPNCRSKKEIVVDVATDGYHNYPLEDLAHHNQEEDWSEIRSIRSGVLIYSHHAFHMFQLVDHMFSQTHVANTSKIGPGYSLAQCHRTCGLTLTSPMCFLTSTNLMRHSLRSCVTSTAVGWPHSCSKCGRGLLRLVTLLLAENRFASSSNLSPL